MATSLIVLNFPTGILCYECRSLSPPTYCISGGEVPKRECDKKYCTIYRQEYLDPAGKVQLFYRSCENDPKYLNAVIKTTNYKTFYRACTDDLCNIGNGLDEFVIVIHNESTPIFTVAGIGSDAGETISCLITLIILTTFISVALSLQ